jgi:hypothetical protein
MSFIYKQLSSTSFNFKFDTHHQQTEDREEDQEQINRQQKQTHKKLAPL